MNFSVKAQISKNYTKTKMENSGNIYNDNNNKKIKLPQWRVKSRKLVKNPKKCSTVASFFEEEYYPKRGRPRAYMGEFDISLIREFRSRPAFYDRNHYRFRDKVFTAREWQEISNKLGYDVSLLKDRMLQLRNRYNLEKRRMEQLIEENPSKIHDSPWPLYEHLQFLSDHIRARRSYKRMVTLHQQSAAIDYNHSNSYSSGSVMCHAAAPFANGMLTVKVEEEENDNATEAGVDSENASNENENSNHLPPPNQLITITDKHSKKGIGTDGGVSGRVGGGGSGSVGSGNHPYLPKITIRRLATENDDMLSGSGNSTSKRARISNHHYATASYATHKSPSVTTTAAVSANQSYGAYDIVPPVSVAAQRLSNYLQNHSNLSTRDQKFIAFGEFISKSLLELPAQKAMLLIQKFTTDIVKTQIDFGAATNSNNDSTSSSNNTSVVADRSGELNKSTSKVSWVNGDVSAVV